VRGVPALPLGTICRLGAFRAVPRDTGRAMSQENVELVKRLYDAWQKDGFGVVPAVMDPDIEYVNPPYAVEPGTRRGYEGFAIAAQNIRNVYPTRRFEPLEFHDARDRGVAVRVRVVACGVGSSVEVDVERGYVFEVRDGKIVRFAWFTEPLEALEAVGLEE
jgi:ketosteroid isomerase-like protein